MSIAFKIFRKNCCGLDVHKTWIYACIGITDPNNRIEYKQACCPRNDSSAQKVKSTRISRAGSFLKPILVQIANALIKSKNYLEFQEHYRRIKARRGHMKAIIAVCRMLLTAIWNILTKLEPYSAKGYLADKLTEQGLLF